MNQSSQKHDEAQVNFELWQRYFEALLSGCGTAPYDFGLINKASAHADDAVKRHLAKKAEADAV